MSDELKVGDKVYAAVIGYFGDMDVTIDYAIVRSISAKQIMLRGRDGGLPAPEFGYRTIFPPNKKFARSRKEALAQLVDRLNDEKRTAQETIDQKTAEIAKILKLIGKEK